MNQNVMQNTGYQVNTGLRKSHGFQNNLNNLDGRKTQ